MDLTKLLVDDQGGSRINNITSERTARSLLTRLWEKIMSGYRAGDGKVKNSRAVTSYIVIYSSKVPYMRPLIMEFIGFGA